MSTTFHCPFCGAPIAGAAPGITFACPYCRAKVMAPYDGHASGAPSGRGWDGGASQAGPSAPLSNGVDGVAVTVDPELGFIAIGAHAPHGQPPCLRAWDVKAGRALWETLQGQGWLEGVRRSTLAILGRNVYVANKRQLLCLDLASGSRKWTASLSDVPDSEDDGLSIADPFPQGPGQRGAILVPTIDHCLFAFDRDSGQPLWHRAFGDTIVHVEVVPNLGACVVRYGFPYVKAEIVNPAFAQPIASFGHDHWSTDLGRAKVSGRSVITAAEDMGPDGDDDGLLCFDAVTGQIHFFEPIEDLETDEIAPCAMGARVFAATSDGKGLYVGPRGRTMPPPVPNHSISALVPAGPALALLLRKSHGTPVRRIIAIDPHTLAFRFDAGEAGTEPDDDWTDQLATDGYTLVFVATPTDDLAEAELRSVDTSTGRMLWSRPVGSWCGHRFIGGQLVVWSDTKIELLSPPNGQVLASLTL
ncbi:MAG: PQQ-binding-like beta-propeller repeat protein [Labilithrix sp.]|nr:PQQ-binding-like beta-propeller repeat protein [Labilithrix sp.]MBX3221357.1 PQQ-binding-like beta-propeller repeat protein [Labilithrix sp.]